MIFIYTRVQNTISLSSHEQVFNEATFREILLPSCATWSFTLPDDGRSISRNVAALNILVQDLINLLYYEHWTDKRNNFYVRDFKLKKVIFGVSTDSNNMAIVIIIGIYIWGGGKIYYDLRVFAFLSFSKWNFYEYYLK